ncbi:MAG TPA: methylenetetrahydrofolate reductase [NAD(P)H] [bacterium]|nr:methylenetetrahydrofolate reductase [NAD(P)H] [bacterium]
MKISGLFTQKPRVLSFELFAPKKDEDIEKLFQTVEELKKLQPDYISITYGAGGSSRGKTFDIAVRLRETGITPLVHFTCVDHSREEVRQLLNRLKAVGIENVLALRGDPPQGQNSFTPPPDGFRYANELVQFIRSEGYDFCLGVAGYPEGHPEAKSKDDDLVNLKKKIDVGGQFIVTQLFFNSQDYFRFVEKTRALGIHTPIQPGIWLLSDYAQIQKICGLCGATLPQGLRDQLEPAKDDKEKVAQIGMEWAVKQCEDLLKGGAPGIHFYVLNRSQYVRAVVEKLAVRGLRFNH